MELTSCLLMFNLHSLSYTGQAGHGLPFISLPTIPMIASPHTCSAHPYNSLSCPLSRHSLRQRIGLRLSHRHDSLFSAKIDSWHVEGQTNEQQNKSLIIYPGRQRLKAAPVREKPHPLFFFGPFERASASFHSNMFDVASTAAIQSIKRQNFGTVHHSGRVCASHPAVTGLNLSLCAAKIEPCKELNFWQPHFCS